MKGVLTFLVIILLITIAGCNGGGIQSKDGFIIVDVTKRYPQKELILQDCMDVEYIPLETNDEFLTQGRVLAISKNFIVVKNRINDGDIFIFDRTTGKSLKKINRRGQGPEEYIDIQEIVLDEDMDEMYVHNAARSGRLLIYNLDGKFKRSIVYKQGVSFWYLHNFDRENLICKGSIFDTKKNMYEHPLLLISKQDGSITKEIQFTYEKEISTSMNVKIGDMGLWLDILYYPTICYFDNWALSLPSSDTIYKYQPDHTMTPLIVRTPSIQTIQPKVFLFPRLLTDRYYFMEIVKKGFDPVAKKMPSTELLYDRQRNALFEYEVYNIDYVEKKRISFSPINLATGPRPLNDEIVSWQVLEAYQLVEDYEKGGLKGRLKEIASKLDEDDNPVIMLIKYKKK